MGSESPLMTLLLAKITEYSEIIGYALSSCNTLTATSVNRVLPYYGDVASYTLSTSAHLPIRLYHMSNGNHD
jgi:hypothetical protein